MTAEPFRGKRVRYTGYLNTEEVNAFGAGLWMSVNDCAGTLSFDNMNTRRVKNTTDWSQYEIVLDVPREATHIRFGFFLAGNGILWGDDLSLDVVDQAVLN